MSDCNLTMIHNSQVYDNFLMHWKYIRREKVNGKWRYYYEDTKLKNREYGVKVAEEKMLSKWNEGKDSIEFWDNNYDFYVDLYNKAKENLELAQRQWEQIKPEGKGDLYEKRRAALSEAEARFAELDKKRDEAFDEKMAARAEADKNVDEAVAKLMASQQSYNEYAAKYVNSIGYKFVKYLNTRDDLINSGMDYIRRLLD